MSERQACYNLITRLPVIMILKYKQRIKTLTNRIPLKIRINQFL